MRFPERMDHHRHGARIAAHRPDPEAAEGRAGGRDELGELEAALRSVPPEALLDGPPDGADVLRRRVLSGLRPRRPR